MARKPAPQLFAATADLSKPNSIIGSNQAVYTIPGRNAGEPAALILVECRDGGGNVPRNATSFDDLKFSFQAEMEAVARVAESAIETLKQLSPGEVEIEFGIELGGSAGIPMITKTEGKANFKVTLKWKRSEVTES